jgi:hypothetical protein
MHTNETKPPTYEFDGRSRIGKLLAGYDASYSRKDAAAKQAEGLQAEHDLLVAAIKAEVENLGLDRIENKLNLDSAKLDFILRLGTGDRTEITKDGKALLQTQHPKLWAQITDTKSVTTLRRLTGKEWLKNKAGAK